jgi:hypothetical protein
MLQQSVRLLVQGDLGAIKRLIQACYIGPIRGALTAYRHQQQIFALLTREKLSASGPHGREKYFRSVRFPTFHAYSKRAGKTCQPFGE